MARNRYTYARRGPLNKSIRDAARDFGDMAGVVIVDAMFYMGSEVKENTPYRTGRATGHWKLAINSRPGGYDPTLTEARGRAIDVAPIESYKVGDTLYLYNMTPYAILLEEGFSSQADPGQMLRAQASRFQEFMDRAADDNGM